MARDEVGEQKDAGADNYTYDYDSGVDQGQFSGEVARSLRHCWRLLHHVVPRQVLLHTLFASSGCGPAAAARRLAAGSDWFLLSDADQFCAPGVRAVDEGCSGSTLFSVVECASYRGDDGMAARSRVAQSANCKGNPAGLLVGQSGLDRVMSRSNIVA